MKVGVATTSELAAAAAREVASKGGNAVDCALAAALVAINTEPGVCALAGSAFVTVWAPDAEPVTIDGNVAVPGRGLERSELSRGATSVSMAYGGGITTLVGCGSVAVPGALAAIEQAWKRFGQIEWHALFEPAIRAARDGFPMSKACRYYLDYSADCVFGRSDDGYRSVHDDQGHVLDVGSRIHVPHLAASLEAIAADGADVFYAGDLGKAIVSHVRAGGGALTMSDLAEYRAIERPSLIVDSGAWRIATNPPPAIGGAVLAAMLIASSDPPVRAWDREALARIIRVQTAALNLRKTEIDLAEDIGRAAAHLIEVARQRRLIRRYESASTVHTSAVDENGLGCAITASSGYGSGEMPRGTGLWLNNCLGEIELNRRGLQAGPPGARLPSNMAPSVARDDVTVLAAGTPGADRITTAMQQFLISYLNMGMPLIEAIAHPRLHVDTSGDADRLMVETGLDIPEVDLPVQLFEGINMYFGGVAAASYDPDRGFQIGADPRREGGVALCDG